MITEVIHHIDKRVPCDGCTTRVFTFADELNVYGDPTGRHFCTPCAAKEAKGEDSTAWRKRAVQSAAVTSR